jgi:isopentenyldiphosphate isomerase
MSDELLDLVNSKDQVIGEIWKSDAHKDPQSIHREISVIVVNHDNKVLFQKRSKRKRLIRAFGLRVVPVMFLKE